MSILVPKKSQVPDSTLNWARRHAVDGLVRPSLVLRCATDNNFIFHHKAYMNAYNSSAYDCAAVMNTCMPGMRMPGVLNWQVTENVDSIVQTAKVEILNALPVSQRTATLKTAMLKQYHSRTVSKHWVKNPDGITKALGGSLPLDYYVTTTGGYQYIYKEDRLLYREFADESITCNTGNLAGWPDPSIPNDESDQNTVDPQNGTGVGSYFVLIDQEVMRVYDISGDTLKVQPGGRGINGVIQAHAVGATVSLLGFGPYTGKWTGMGYLVQSESKPYKNILRPGTCLASYEGYGDLPSSLKKDSWRHDRNYEFTGYWFVKGHEVTIAEDGVPRVSVDLASTGWVLQNQKITPNSVQRLRNSIINWAKIAADEAGHDRRVPGEWVDYNDWMPDRPNSYPLAIKTQFAQDKQFMDHLRDTDNGKNCEFCQQEWLEFINRPGYVVGKNPGGEARAVGRHIYKESIRVYRGGNSQFDGPLRTYGRLILTLAKFAWENPITGNALATKFTKIPSDLWDDMSDFRSGRVWNGQLAFKFKGETPHHPWAEQTQISDDEPAYFYREPLYCPFESSYDKQDWFQPIQDLAEMNKMTFQFHRRGFPIFMPNGLHMRGVSLKPIHENTKTNTGHWFMGWGGSITNYSYSMDPEQALTMVWVSCTDAFESEFSVVGAGTGYDKNGQLIWYSSKVGNKEGLQLTSGVQHVDTISLDNIVVGLDWNTNPAGWSLKLDRTGEGLGITEMAKMPSIPVSHLEQGSKSNNATALKNLKRLWNFLVIRRLIFDVHLLPDNGDTSSLAINTTFGKREVFVVKKMQQFLNDQNYRSGATTGIWLRTDGQKMRKWAKTEGEAIKNDIWWYAISGYDWSYYVSAITGVAVPQRIIGKDNKGEPIWATDQMAYRKKIATWQQNFFKQAINLGNKTVDESIQKATVRQWTSNVADPRIQLGDIVYLVIPGYLDMTDDFGDPKPPFTKENFANGTFITSITRTMDLQNGTYQANYAGYRYKQYIDKAGKDVNLNYSNYYKKNASEI